MQWIVKGDRAGSAGISFRRGPGFQVLPQSCLIASSPISLLRASSAWSQLEEQAQHQGADSARQRLHCTHTASPKTPVLMAPSMAQSSPGGPNPAAKLLPLGPIIFLLAEGPPPLPPAAVTPCPLPPSSSPRWGVPAACCLAPALPRRSAAYFCSRWIIAVPSQPLSTPRQGVEW